jgi:hypothetical protein
VLRNVGVTELDGDAVLPGNVAAKALSGCDQPSASSFEG